MRLLRVTLMVWLALVALIGGAALYGRVHPERNELQTLGFDLCKGKPCLLGIIPGIATSKDAITTLEKRGGTQLLNFPKIYTVADTRIGFQDSRNTVIEIAMSSNQPNRSLTTVGDAMAYWGSPCKVSIYVDPPLRQIILIFFHRSGYTDVVIPDNQEVTPGTVVRSIGIRSDNGCGDDYYPWLGFKSIRRYTERVQ